MYKLDSHNTVPKRTENKCTKPIKTVCKIPGTALLTLNNSLTQQFTLPQTMLEY